MSKFTWVIIGAVLSFPIMANASSMTETMEKTEIQQYVIDLTVKSKWTQLDKLIEEYNEGFPATSGGTQKLVILWGSIYELYGQDVKSINMVADEWMQANPRSTGARMLKAFTYNAEAVRLRGQGSIDTVDPGIIPQYKKVVKQEKEYLLKNKDIAEKDATWYQEMEMVARNLGDKELLYSTLQEGSTKYPEYQNIYLQAMEGRLPKWGGSVEEVEKIARLAVEKTKNKSGLSLYSYIWYNAIAFQPEMMKLLYNHEVVSWDDMHKGWQDRYKQYTSTRTLTNFMVTACLAQDKAAFMEAQKLSKGEYEANLWYPGLEYNKCLAYARK